MSRLSTEHDLRPLRVDKVIAPLTGCLLRTEEEFAVGDVRYRLVVPGFVPAILSDEFRRVRLYALGEDAAVGAGVAMSFRDRPTALRWLVASRF